MLRLVHRILGMVDRRRRGQRGGTGGAPYRRRRGGLGSLLRRVLR